jgi:hypothetical protein
MVERKRIPNGERLWSVRLELVERIRGNLTAHEEPFDRANGHYVFRWISTALLQPQPLCKP